MAFGDSENQEEIDTNDLFVMTNGIPCTNKYLQIRLKKSFESKFLCCIAILIIVSTGLELQFEMLAKYCTNMCLTLSIQSEIVVCIDIHSTKSTNELSLVLAVYQ